MIGARAIAAAALGLLLVVAGAAPARAADEPADKQSEREGDARAEGRRHFEAGEQHFAKGEYALALLDYEAGYRLTRLPGFLINIAHCHRLSGDLRKARAFYRKYLLVEPTSPRKAEVEEIIRRIDEKLAERAPGEGEAAAAAKEPRTPSAKWWLWSALAGSVVGSTVATMALAAAEEKEKR
jgi:tetratricopeptide (TPR) repeat protein